MTGASIGHDVQPWRFLNPALCDSRTCDFTSKTSSHLNLPLAYYDRASVAGKARQRLDKPPRGIAQLSHTLAMAPSRAPLTIDSASQRQEEEGLANFKHNESPSASPPSPDQPNNEDQGNHTHDLRSLHDLLLGVLHAVTSMTGTRQRKGRYSAVATTSGDGDESNDQPVKSEAQSTALRNKGPRSALFRSILKRSIIVGPVLILMFL